MEYISLVLNAILGGGFLVTLITLRSTRKKASAEAKGSELDNVQEAIGIWREMAENLKKELSESRAENDVLQIEMRKEIEGLRKAISKLSTINNKMLKLLDKITPENIDSMIKQIKEIHNEG